MQLIQILDSQLASQSPGQLSQPARPAASYRDSISSIIQLLLPSMFTMINTCLKYFVAILFAHTDTQTQTRTNTQTDIHEQRAANERKGLSAQPISVPIGHHPHFCSQLLD